MWRPPAPCWRRLLRRTLSVSPAVCTIPRRKCRIFPTEIRRLAGRDIRSWRRDYSFAAARITAFLDRRCGATLCAVSFPAGRLHDHQMIFKLLHVSACTFAGDRSRRVPPIQPIFSRLRPIFSTAAACSGARRLPHRLDSSTSRARNIRRRGRQHGRSHQCRVGRNAGQWSRRRARQYRGEHLLCRPARAPLTEAGTIGTVRARPRRHRAGQRGRQPPSRSAAMP